VLDHPHPGIIALANAIPDMRALSSVNLVQNQIGIDQAGALASMLKEHPALKSLCGNKGTETELGMNGKMNGAGDAIMLVAEIIDNGALSVLDLAQNNLGELVLPEGWTGDYDSDEDEEVYRHADGREQKDNPGKPEGIIAIANAIPDMGAISSVNLLQNDISVKQAQELVKIMQSKEKLITLCGLSGNEATLDFSNFSAQGLGPGDAVLIANDISDMRALSKLIFGGDRYHDTEGQLVTPDPASLLLVMTELDLSN
jgi:hypothetical protein